MIMILEGFKPPKSNLETPILTFFNSSQPIFAYCGTIVVTAWFSLCYITLQLCIFFVWAGKYGDPLLPYFLPFRTPIINFYPILVYYYIIPLYCFIRAYNTTMLC